MKKIFSFITLIMICGVVFYGSGCVAAVDVVYLQTIEKQGFVQFGMESNASFLAPIPMIVYMDPQYVSNALYFEMVPDYEMAPYILSSR